MDRRKKSHYNSRVSLHEAPTKKDGISDTRDSQRCFWRKFSKKESGTIFKPVDKRDLILLKFHFPLLNFIFKFLADYTSESLTSPSFDGLQCREDFSACKQHFSIFVSGIPLLHCSETDEFRKKNVSIFLIAFRSK